MEYQNIKCKKEEGILSIALNRPDVRNALSLEMWAEIRASMREARFDSEVKAVILSGEGGKAFASGVDIRVLHDRPTLEALMIESQDILMEIETLPKPVICAINGYALGGGCEVAMSCDIRIATRRSRFGQPEVNLGIIPGAGGTQRLPRLVGPGKAKELIFTGKIIDAQEAERIGLINLVVEDEEALYAAAREMAGEILKKGPIAVMAAKMAINNGQNTDLQSGMVIERLLQTVAFGTNDRLEGTSAFLEKRPAHFEGR